MIDVLGDLFKSKMYFLKILEGLRIFLLRKAYCRVETSYFFDTNNLPCFQSDKCPETVR